jgi:hypothetical protein
VQEMVADQDYSSNEVVRRIDEGVRLES